MKDAWSSTSDWSFSLNKVNSNKGMSYMVPLSAQMTSTGYLTNMFRIIQDNTNF